MDRSALDSVDAYLVYADWLQSQGDPRGELIVVQINGAAAREAELLRMHRKTWLGELAALGARDFGVTWRYGFVHGVRIGPPLAAHEKTEIDVTGAIGRLAHLPAADMIREVTIGAIEHNGFPTTWTPAIAGIATHGLPSNVEKLAIRCGHYWDLDRTALGDLSPAYPKLAKLRSLVIEMGSLELGAIVLPELRELEVITSALQKSNLASLRAAQMPRLESLWLALGEFGEDDEYRWNPRCDIEPADLRWIYAGETLGNVRRLGLASSSFTDEIVRGLAGSKILAQLETLDLSLGTLSDGGAAAILANADRFRHLRRLDLSHAYLSDHTREQLAVLGPEVVLDDPQSPDDDFRLPAIR